MTIRAISLFLILTLGAGVLSGMPLHADEQNCVHGMSGMDCCKTAQGQGSAHEVAAARVCCAVICPQSGTTGSSSVPVPKPSLGIAITFPAVALSVVPRRIPVLYWSQSHGPPTDSNPAYIRNLSLLI
jgi:hypothetical protein